MIILILLSCKFLIKSLLDFPSPNYVLKEKTKIIRKQIGRLYMRGTNLSNQQDFFYRSIEYFKIYNSLLADPYL